MVKTSSLIKVKTLNMKIARQVKVLNLFNPDHVKLLKEHIVPKIDNGRYHPEGWIMGQTLSDGLSGVYWLINTDKGLYWIPSIGIKFRGVVDQLFIG
jgi:hypothetical protein